MRTDPTVFNLAVVVAGLLACWWIVHRAQRKSAEAKARLEWVRKKRPEHIPLDDEDVNSPPRARGCAVDSRVSPPTASVAE